MGGLMLATANVNKLMSYAIMVSVALIIIAIVLPIGLTYLGKAGDVTTSINGTAVSLSEAVDPSIITLLTVVLPIMVVISLVLYFIPRTR